MMKRVLLFLLFILSISYSSLSQVLSPILVKPPTTSNMVSLNVELDWSDVANATYYEIEMSTDAEFTSFIPYIFPQVTVSNFTCPNGVLESNTLYFWRIRAFTSVGSSDYSAVYSFRTIGTSSQEVTNLSGEVLSLVNSNQLSASQASILISKLNSAQYQISLDHKLYAALYIGSFILRVYVLEGSNLISIANGNKLINHAVGIIQLLGGDSPIQSAFNNVPDKFSLDQNYPNPFNPSTTIEYSIPKNGNVSLKIFDITGKEIAVLVDKYQNAGSYIVTWNAAGVSSGVYFYRLTNGENISTKRMVLTK